MHANKQLVNSEKWKEQRGHSSKHLLLCSKVERKSNMFGMTCGWVGKHPNEKKSLLSYFSTVLNFLSVDRSGLMCLIWGDCLEFPWGLSIKLVLWKSWMSDSSEVEERLRLETHSQSQVCVRAREPGARRWGGSTGGGEQGEELGQRASMWHWSRLCCNICRGVKRAGRRQRELVRGERGRDCLTMCLCGNDWEIVLRQLRFRNEGTERWKEIEPERVFFFYCIVP